MFVTTVVPVLVTCDEAATAVPVMEISAVVNVVVQLAVFDATAQLTSIVLAKWSAGSTWRAMRRKKLGKCSPNALLCEVDLEYRRTLNELNTIPETAG